ncbi:hypothetical protein [Escherichia coli]|uniref:hypothetical protein n=1 Tax=Escherichia coli TaxID=562 RepID=UPI000BE829ED|nr:hypothetical protein [Escherichia coli]
MLKSFCLNFDGMYLSIVSFLSEKFNLKRVGKMELESKEDYEETTHHNVASSVVTATHDNLDGREFFELCSNPALVFSFETHKKFNELPVDSKESPLDLFIANTKQLHLLRSGDISNILSHLLLLGYVSAAESYLRALIRNLINHDEYIQSIVSDKAVSYAAAQHHKKELLPEALLEDFSLASPYNVFETLKDIIGMKGQRPIEMMKCSSEFMKVCELRHCCVHRFGKLGSKNAIRLGLAEHMKHLEKPIILNNDDLEQIAFIVENFIRTLNNTVFKFIINRTVENKNKEKGGERLYDSEWTWVFEKDISRYEKYYAIFSAKNDTLPGLSLQDSYQLFVNAYKPKLPARKNKKTEEN